MPRFVVRSIVALTIVASFVLSAAPAAAATSEPSPGSVIYTPPVDAPIQDPFRPPATPYGPGNRGIEYARVRLVQEPLTRADVRTLGCRIVDEGDHQLREELLRVFPQRQQSGHGQPVIPHHARALHRPPPIQDDLEATAGRRPGAREVALERRKGRVAAVSGGGHDQLV